MIPKKEIIWKRILTKNKDQTLYGEYSSWNSKTSQ